MKRSANNPAMAQPTKPGKKERVKDHSDDADGIPVRPLRSSRQHPDAYFYVAAPFVVMGLCYLYSLNLKPGLAAGQRVAFERPEQADMMQMRHTWGKAVTTLDISGEKVSIQMNTIPRGLEGHTRLPDDFYRDTFFSISGWDPGGIDGKLTREQNNAANQDLRQALRALKPAPGGIIECSFKNFQEGWVQEGFLIRYSGIVKGHEEEHAVARLARKYGQVAIFRWKPHVWGADPLAHATVMQSIVPTGGRMHELVTEGPAYRVEGGEAHA